LGVRPFSNDYFLLSPRLCENGRLLPPEHVFMATKAEVAQAIQSIQKQIDRIIQQFGTTGVPLPQAEALTELALLTQAIQARDLLRNEGAVYMPTS
jgi:hypothetical protein